MRKWKRALAFMLALVMALSLVALPSFAEGEETGSAVTGGGTRTTGLELNKVYNPETGLLTLEAYATGSTTTTTSTAPVDIVLVLDVSGSMDQTITGGSYRYNEVYDLSTSGEYYYKSGNSYKLAYYCEGEGLWGSRHNPGWYTSDTCTPGGHWGSRLTPKQSAEDPTQGATQFYTREYVEAVTKMDALKTAVKGFVNSVSEKSPESSIAIVKFGGEIKNQIGNDRYNYSGENINYTQTVKGLTPASSAAELNAEIDTLRYGGYTPAHLGLQLAKGIIENDPNTDRQKVVVLFTDGEPNGVGNTTSGFQTAAANNAIANSKSIKDAGATVYTIGCFGSLSGNNKTNVDTYMNRVSSNYPDATNMNDGTRGVGDFYKTVSSASELESIFQEISSTAGGATLQLGAETVLKDVVSEYFDLPDNASSQITAQSYSCTGFDASGNPTWSDTPDTASYAVTVDGKNVSVSGFNYSDNWVGKDTTTGAMHNPGKKLVVTIPIVDNGTGMGTVPTNAETSAVYDKDGSRVCAFAVPTAYFPYFTVTHIQSNVDDSGKNYGENAGSTKHRVPTNGEKFDLTSVVNENYLYGGSFNGEDCTTVQPYSNGENPTAFTPQDKAEYFIWEVPNTYLTPRNYSVWRHLPEKNGELTVVRLYPLTAADRTLYKQVGFVIDNKDYVSGCGEFGTAISNAAPTLYQTAVAMKNGQHYETLYLSKGAINASGTAIDESGLVSGQHIDDGCLAGIRLDAEGMTKFESANGVTFQPYWITLDNVKVYGATARTCTYVANSKTAKVTNTNNALPCEYVGDTVSTQAMSFAKSFTMDDSQPVVDESLTVTVVDGSNTTQVKVAPNGSVRDQVAYQAPAGKVFAGWFADQACTTPADLDQVTEDTTIYAKYVSDSYLDLDYSRTGLFRLRGVTLISAVDNRANYQASGFIVEGEKVDVSYASRYLIFKTPANLFGAARNAQLMLADQSLSGTGTLEVTPYWVTLDGTEVQGQTHTLHYNTRTIWE